MNRLSFVSLVALILTACAASQQQPEPLPESPPAPTEPAVETVAVAQAGKAEESSAPAADSAPAVQPEPARDASARVESPTLSASAARAAPNPIEPADAAPSAVPPDTGDAMAGRAQAAAADGLSLSGRVEIRHNGRQSAAADTSLGQTVIAWRPMRPVTVPAMPAQRMMTRQSRFYPQTLAVTSGTEVAFPNFDTIDHNVFSLTEDHQFDVGLYGPGESESRILQGLGMVELFCNEHPNMAAFILVLDTPFFTSPDADGHFQLDDLPPGEGELLVWNYRSEHLFQRSSLSLAESVDQHRLIVNVTRPTVPQHTNKHGEAYSRRSR